MLERQCFTLIVLSLAPAFAAEGRDALSPQIVEEVRKELAGLQPSPAVEFQEIASLPRQQNRVVAMAFSGDSKRLVVCTNGGECSAWDLQTKKKLSRFSKKLGGAGEFCVAMSPDGKYGVVGGGFPGVHVFDVSSGSLSHTFQIAEKGTWQLAVSEDNKWMTALGHDNVCYSYPLLGGAGNTVKSPDPLTTMAVSPTREFVLLATLNKNYLQFARFPCAQSPTVQTATMITPCVPVAMVVSPHLFAYAGPGGEWKISTLPSFTERTAMFTLEVQGSQLAPHNIAMTPDEEHLVAVLPSGDVEIVTTRVIARPIQLKIPSSGAAVAVAISQDGQTFAMSYDRGPVVCWRLPAIPAPSEARFRCLLQRYLANKQYDQLEALSMLLDQDPKSFPWATSNTKCGEMVASLVSAIPLAMSPEYDTLLRDWLKARPDARLAKVLQAVRYVKAGWAARGSGFADSVTAEGAATFRANMEKAREIVMPLVDSDNCPTLAYWVLFDVARAQSWDREKVDRYVEKLMKRAPWYFSAHQQVAELLMPRWGGESGDSATYALKIAKRIGGADGRMAYAQITKQMLFYYSADELFGKEQFNYEYFKKGMEEILRQYPNDPRTLHDLLRTAWRFHNRQDAERYWKQIKGLNIHWSRGSWTQQEFAQARAWLENPE